MKGKTGRVIKWNIYYAVYTYYENTLVVDRR